MNGSKIFVAIIAVFMVIVASLFLGEAVASGDYAIVGGIMGGSMALAGIFILRQYIWVLIPMFAAFTGKINALPIPFSVSNIVLGYATGVLLIYGLAQSKWRQYRMSLTDCMLLACLLCMGVTFLQNPVGLSSMGSSTVGSRPYFEVALACMGYLALAWSEPNLKILRKVPIISLCTGVILSAGMALSYYWTKVGNYMNMAYSGFVTRGGESATGGHVKIERIKYLGPVNKSSLLWGLTRDGAWNPKITGFGITVAVLAFSALAALLSGHRIAVVNWVAYVTIFCLLTRRIQLLFVCGALGVLGLTFIYAYHHTIGEIPASAQRALCFLPGDWDPWVVRQATDTIEWRIEMWQEVLEDGDLIRNKIFGDGFGFSAQELELVQEQSHGLGGVTGIRPQDLAQYYLITGELHSGPLSSIRYVGYVGLLFFTLLTVAMAGKYIRLARAARGTPLWGAIAFFAVPAIWFPIKFVALYGAYNVDFPVIIVGLGWLKFLEVSLRSYWADQAALSEMAESAEEVPQDRAAGSLAR